MTKESEIFDRIVGLMKFSEDWTDEDRERSNAVSMSMSILGRMFVDLDSAKMCDQLQLRLTEFLKQGAGLSAIVMMVKLGQAYFNSEVKRRGGAEAVMGIPKGFVDSLPPSIGEALNKAMEEAVKDMESTAARSEKPKSQEDWMKQFSEKHKRS